MSNIDAVIAQVISEFSAFSSFIDEDTLYREAVLSTKEIGNIATETYEDVLDISKGVGYLPDYFYKINVALLVKEYKDNESLPIEIRTLVDTEYVVENNFRNTSWIDCNSCCKTDSYGFKESNLFIKTTLNENKCYGKFEPVSIAKHSIKSSCVPDCINKGFSTRKQISVDYRRGKVHANFNEGSLFIKFKGFPADEKGELDFNDTANGNFERYIEYSLKTKIAEILIPVPPAAAIVQSLGYYSQQKSYYKLKASQEKIYENFDPKEFTKKLQLQNRIDYKRLANER